MPSHSGAVRRCICGKVPFSVSLGRCRSPYTCHTMVFFGIAGFFCQSIAAMMSLPHFRFPDSFPDRNIRVIEFSVFDRDIVFSGSDDTERHPF